MKMISLLHFLCVFTLVAVELKICASAAVPVIRLDLTDSCRSEAEFEWLILENEDGLANCTIQYNIVGDFSVNSSKIVERVPLMENSGTFTIKGLFLGQTYSVQIVCIKASSDALPFSIQDKDCALIENQSTPSGVSVVEFKENTSILGTRDSVLGIVFALFGLLIIMVTTFYILRKIRRRQRLERIRRYLGSSLIDPFENMQDREPESGSERLIESTDS